MNKKTKNNKAYHEFVKIRIGHSIAMKDLLLDLGTWFQNGDHAMYIDILQYKRSKEASFFTNSYFTMDLEVLKEILEAELGCCVGLRWKPIAGIFDSNGDAVRAIHMWKSMHIIITRH